VALTHATPRFSRILALQIPASALIARFIYATWERWPTGDFPPTTEKTGKDGLFISVSGTFLILRGRGESHAPREKSGYTFQIQGRM